MLSLTAENPVTLLQLAARIPGQRAKENISYHTIYNWATVGVKGVKLETVMLGGKRMTTLEAFDRFVQETNPRSEEITASLIKRPKSKRILAAKKRLKRHGI